MKPTGAWEAQHGQVVAGSRRQRASPRRVLAAARSSTGARLGAVALGAALSTACGGVPAGGADVPSLDATVTGMRFFEDGRQPGPPATRWYDDTFLAGTARYVYWELSLEHPAAAEQRQLTIAEVWTRAGRVEHRNEHRFALEAGWTHSTWYASANLQFEKFVEVDSPFADPLAWRCRGLLGEWGPCPSTMGAALRPWRPGVYEVELAVDGTVAARRRFRVLDRAEMDEEIATIARLTGEERASGRVRPLAARVAGFRLLESGWEVPPPRQRRYAVEFARGATRFIAWQLDLEHAAARQATPVDFEAHLRRVEGKGTRLLQRKVMPSLVPSGWKDTYHVDWVGPRPPDAWASGTYRVDLFVDGEKIAGQAFVVR